MAKPYKCRVEYLESTGGQWIDIGVGVKSNTIAKAIFSIASTATGRSYFGARNSSNERFQIVNSFGVGNGYFYNANIYPIANQKYEIEMHANGDVYLDGVKRNATNGTFSPVAFDRSLYIFSTNYYDDSGVPSASTFWKVQILEGDTLVRDMIPVLDLSGRPAMYDQVSGKLFYNQGTGEFTYGRQIIPVEYLESTGTQYIDTGIQPTDDYGYKIKNTYTYGGGEQCAIGCMDSGNRFVGVYTGGGTQISCGWGEFVGYIGNHEWTDDTIWDVECNYKNNRIITANGVSKDISDIHITGTISNSIYIGARHYGSSLTKMRGKIYGVEITNGTEVIANFIPCMDENHVPFMFDLVNCTVYLNAGTGQFKVGPNVEKMWGGKKLRRKLALALANLKKKRRYYCEVEYLENTGTGNYRNWINTGIVPDTTTRWEVRLSFNNTTTGKLMGCGYVNPTRFNIGLESNKFRFAFNSWFDANSNITTPDTNIHTWIMDAPSKTFTIDEYSTTTTQTFGVSTFPICLFGRGNSASGMTETTNTVIGKIYYTKIWQNGVLVRDMIPVLDWDMTPCMFDKVTEQFFYNMNSSGTGFTVGRQIHKVDYLESTGTQWIDTGVSIDTSTDKIDMDFELVDTRLYKWFFGEYDNNARIGLGSGDGTNLRNYLYQQSVTKINDSEMYGARHNFYIDQTGGYLNGTKIRSYVSFAATSTIYLFNLNIESTSDYKCASKIYKYKHYRNNALIRDFIPAIDENGVGFMFDRVTHTIFDNAGTGAFAYPPVELEYIETDGTSYINTGYTPSGSTETEITTMLKNQNTSRFMFGCRTANGQDIYACLSHSSNRIGYRVGTGGYLYPSGYDELNTKHTYKIANGVFYRDDEVINTTCEGATASPNSPLALLTVNTNNILDTAQTFIGNFYSCTVKENNTFVRDFIPVFKDGQAGMLDKVNNVFYPSSGNNPFTAGAIVEPEYE